jgi:hypothetical protein
VHSRIFNSQQEYAGKALFLINQKLKKVIFLNPLATKSNDFNRFHWDRWFVVAFNTQFQVITTRTSYNPLALLTCFTFIVLFSVKKVKNQRIFY